MHLQSCHPAAVATYLAFLRAINLGAKRKFPKAAIVRATEAAEFTDVATHINTGNVRLETRMRSRERIESALEAAYAEEAGFEVPTIVFTQAELRAIAEEAVSFAHEGRHYVSLLKHEPSASDARALEALSTDLEVAKVSGRAVHLMLGESYRDAWLSGATVEKRIGVSTNRNVTVINALVEKWC